MQLEEALKLKAEANEELKSGNVDNAIILYRDAIKVCPVEKVKDLSILHNNRGLCFVKNVFILALIILE